MNSHGRASYKPDGRGGGARRALALQPPKSHFPPFFFFFSHIRGRVDSALSGLFHVLRLDDTSDIQPVVLLARQSISSQSGGGPFG